MLSSTLPPVRLASMRAVLTIGYFMDVSAKVLIQRLPIRLAERYISAELLCNVINKLNEACIFTATIVHDVIKESGRIMGARGA